MPLESRKSVIDLDDTLGGLRYVLMETMTRVAGKEVHWSKWDILSMDYVYGITNDEFLEIAQETMLLERSVPHPEAREFMYRLFDADIETTILTARAWHPRARAITEHWLGLYNIPYTNLVLCGLDESKTDYISRMENVLFTVDDSKRHCNGFAALTHNRPKFVFTYDMPWNTNVDEGVIRIKNLLEVGNYIEGL